MNTRTIRASAVVFALSAAILMVSASQVQAKVDGYAVCTSGRCIRGTGIVIQSDPGGPVDYSSAKLMVDLVARYIAIESDIISRRVDGVAIHYAWTRIDVTGYFASARIRIGIPGGATAVFGDPIPYTFRFYGFASYYLRVDFFPT